MLCGCDCSSSHTTEPFKAKMDDWEQCAPAALDYLIEWMESERETLLAVSKGRVALGHYRYGDKLMYEFTQPELLSNAAEELGDAIAYIARLIHLRDNAAQPLPRHPELDELIAS